MNNSTLTKEKLKSITTEEYNFFEQERCIIFRKKQYGGIRISVWEDTGNTVNFINKSLSECGVEIQRLGKKLLGII